MLCLTVESDAEWATAAMTQLDGLLVDHAHCERKAAANALSLRSRFPAGSAVSRALEGIAEEEEDHFRRVGRLLEARGLTLGPPSVDTYAADLRRASTRLPALRSPLIDRLLVGALIEARSCERFKLLTEALDACRPKGHGLLRDFYGELLASEARHYRTFVDLACEVARPDHDEPVILGRLAELARLEAQIVAALADGRTRATMHG
jgi:tRNA-(ms[2]io[6]A)-hydroxylase